MPACFVNGCKKNSKTSNLQKDGITFHLFPQNLLQRRKWTEACNRSKDWMPTPSSSICSRHFEASQFRVMDTNSRQLIKTAIPTLLLQKHELDMANLDTSRQIIPRFIPKYFHSNTTHEHKDKSGGLESQYEDIVNMNDNTTSQQIIPKVIAKLLQSTTPHKYKSVFQTQNKKPTLSSISEINSNNQDLKRHDVNPIEYLQMFIEQLMPNIKDDNAIYVVLVNNEKMETGSDHLANRTDNFPNGRNEFGETYLRNRLIRKTKLAEERLKKIRILSQARRRLVKKNRMLMDMIDQLKTQNLRRNISSPFKAPKLVDNLDFDGMKSDSEPYYDDDE